MKRPQGFDRPVAPRAGVPDAPAPAAPESSPESSPERPAAVGTVTEPIPIVRQDVVATPREPERETPREASEADRAARRYADAAIGRIPSNREISRALRAARAERKRVERGEVRRFTKRSRHRRMLWLGGAGVVVALVLGVVLVGLSPLLALRHVEVVGASRLDPAAIATKLDDQVGKPLALLDQAEISSDLAGFPLIRSYTLESHPPDTLVVRIVERQPIGVVQQGSAFVLVDEAKVPISSSATRPADFPLISATGAAADANADSGFAAASAVLASLPTDVLGRVDTISAKTKDDVSFTLRGSGATVVWGSAEDSALKSADLAALLKGAPDARRYDVSSPHSVTTG
ncbi:cell division protein FtsQ [Leifsonia sp. Leaf336]|uniref:FtsQ-type POTRA domain-containing protein n=1 Tax=Leifsonia sp. Leaf336 TaxID=1736341 RepID=UPI0006FCE740|nr:FtsQ-type POTRA domain-containing protein [Leifsonia sp. Leaf336]KQR54393.1 cell division protein FtsQ [Leifsonia sp. Leaf336]